MKNDPWGGKCNIPIQIRCWLVVELKIWKKTWTNLKYGLEVEPVIFNKGFDIGSYNWRDKLRENLSLAPELNGYVHLFDGT